MILNLVRMKGKSLRPKFASILTTALISGLLVSIPVPANAAECDSISTTVGSDTVLTFADVGTCEWTVPAGVTAVRVLVVGGGASGSAGVSNVYWPAGGGGGAVVANSSISVTAGNKVTIAVGAGGAATATTSGAVGNSGGSSAFGSTTASGGLTNSNVTTNNAGRIGGTSGNGNIGGTGTSSGSNCTTGSCGSGGGGGAGGAGGVTDVRNGGVGVNSDISGSTVGYGGGGAGGNGSSGSASHGGAIGYYVSTSASATGNGVANTGGGGSRANGGHGGAGGSGVVIVRFLTQCNPDSVVVGTQTVVSFTDIGTCNWTVPTGVTSVRALVVAGGGAGGGGVSGSYFGAGGGGGEVLELSSVPVSTPMSVTVGAGGIASAYSTKYTGADLALRNGSNSSFGSNTARGGKTPTDSTPVGGPTNLTPAGGVSGNGNSGTSPAGGTWGNGGSGAAAGAVGQRPGAGVVSSISGTSLEYGGGGDGNNNVASDSPRDGAGTREVEALPNRGGGGSIMPSANYGGGAGGSGVVIISYASSTVTEPVEVPANCRAGVGIGGLAGTTANQAGHGCVLIRYSLSNKTYYQSFNYTGSNQSWTTPSDVNSVTFYLLGAGGGAMNVAGRGPGGSGGFATGTYAVSAPTTFTIIVGQGGNGTTQSLDTYGGGGKADYGSGGGRSAIRLPNATEDLITAGGAGGGGYDAKCGGAGGGTTGQDAVIRTTNGEHGKGGTQTAGGAGGYSVNARTGGNGVKYQGGLGRDESGGGGGGFYGGGGGGDNIGAGGGSGYLNPTLITSGRLVQGTCTTPGNSSSLRFTVSYNGNNNTSGTAPTETAVNAFTSATLATNSGTLVRTGYTFSGWNTRADGAGTTYTAGQTNFTPPGDLTLFALWNSTITYNANGATGTVPTAVTTSTDASRTFNLNSGSGLTRTGLNFAGWNTAADGSGTNYAGGASYTSTGTATLFAIFRPTYTYNANGATGGTVPASTIGPVPGAQCFADPGFNNCRVFTYTGSDQQFTLPTGMDISKGVLVEVWGAGGGGSVAYYGDPSGGAGGYSKATLTTPTAGEVLTIVVGQGGLVRDQTRQYGGGGPGGEGGQVGSSGGGYSGIFTGTTPLVISGGGGGTSPGSATNGTAGGGGGANQNGGQAGTAAVAGRGGTSSAGGASATGNSSCPTSDSISRNGSSLQGGASCNQANAEGGGGGGGGYFGGGGGTYQTAGGGPENGGGGGGSGYLDLTRGTLVTATAGENGVLSNFSYPDVSSLNYANNAGRGGKPYTNTVAENSGGNGLITIHWNSSTVVNPVASNTGNLTRAGYKFAGWNTAANGSGTSVPAGSTFPSSASVTLFAAWEPDNTGLSPSFNTNTSSPIGVLANTAYVINTVYTNNTNDLVLSQYADKIQIIASVPVGVLAITTTTNLTLPIGYQGALNTAGGTISFVGNLADVNAALASLRYTANSTASSTTITITASYAGFNGDYRYNPATGSYYLRGATAVVRQAALDPTTASSNCGVKFNGMCGYMTVPNDAAESLYIATKIGQGWIGLTKSNSTLQYVANAPSGLPTPPFTNWSSGEGGITAETNIGIRFADGKWADLSTQTENPIYEFGGKSETPIFGVLTRTIAIGGLVATATPTLDSASDTGTSSTDKITNDNTPTINIGGLTVGATVTLTATPASGTAVTCTFVATTTTGSCTFASMLDGTYSIVATQTLGGTTTAGSTALANVQIDTVRPTVTLSSASIVSGGNSLATPAAPSQNYNINAIFSKTVSGFVIGEITKNAESTGWEITTTALSTSALSSYTFNVRNSTGAGNTAGKLFLSVAEGVATDAAGNTNLATTSSFIINTVIQLTLTNQYQAGINPVVGGNNATVVQSSNGASVDLTGQGGVTRANHTFAGWSLVTTNGSGAVIPSPFTPTVPLFLYSSWVADIYVVTYNANGGNGTPTATSQNYTFGASNLSLTTKGTLARTGYTFAGWNTLATGSGTNYLENASYKPAASIILYAKWTANSYTLTYNANGGTTNSTVSITAGTPVTLSTTAGTRAGYTLAGWNTLADGSGTSYAGSTSQTFFSDVTLYGLWRPVKPGAPSVSAASAGNTTATVTVTGAAVSGTTAGPATSYSIQTYANDGTTVITGKSCTVLATASPLSCEITGLTNGTTYKFLATAINTTGSTAGLISTVTAIPAPFVVTYSLNGGTLTPTTANFTLGTPLTLPLPTRSGYTFTGWNTAANGSGTSVGLNGGSYSPPATITLTAQWSAIVYTISYNGNGNTAGAAPSAGSFSTGGNSHSISSAGNLVKTGYTFDGWTTGSNGSGTAYAAGASYSTSANLVLYAKWTPQVYTITYDKNGAGGAPSRATDSFTFGSTPLTLPAVTGMTYANYTFGGWSETSTGTAVISPYSPTQTRTLYAIWTGIQYSVSYNVNGGTGSVAEAVYTTGATGLTLNNGSSLSRTGYNFGGWRNLAGTTVSGSPYIATENVTLYAIWTPKTIVVTYDKGIATTTPTVFPTSPANATFGANFTLGNSDTSTVISSSNFAFAGWKIGADTYKSGDSYRISGENPVTVTAQWIRLFEVTYNLNGGVFAAGDGINDSQCASTLCTDGQQIALNLAPTRTGFSFAGWVNQIGTNFSAAATTNVAETNYIFYATWTPNSYRITYAVGAGATSSAATAQTGNFGDIVTLASGANYTLSGSIFSGWLITSNLAAGALYTLGTDAGTLTAGTYELTATAQYANNTFKVFYNTNGATAGNTPAATVAASGAAINLDGATGFSRSGFTFDGWSDGTTNLVAGSATTMGSANSTLIAQWKIAIPVTPTISSVSGSDGGATVTVAAGSGGGDPASYTVTSSPAGGSCTITAPATSCSVSPLTNGTAYTFSVTATNSTGTSAAATSAAITPAGKPDAPTGVTATVGNGLATVSFVAPASTGGPAITGYTITSSPAGATCTVGANATTYSCTGLTNGTAYTFAVVANNGIATSDASTSSLAVTPATVPGAPTSVTAISSASGVATVSFTAPVSNGSAITGYTVTSSPAGATCTVGANATTYSCSGLTDGTAYTFSVVATNSIGNSTAATAAAVTPQGAASAVTTISAVAGDGSAVITFSGAAANGSTITSYTVQAYDSSGSAVSGATCTATTSATGGSCTVTGLTNGSQYTFKAVTNSTANSSSVSSIASIATAAVTPAKAPEAPTGITTTAGTGKVTVGWTEPADNGSAITSYTVQAYDSAGNAVAGATCTATGTTCDVSANLAAGSAYTFKVTATSAAGTSAASTASTSASVNAAPSEPRNVTAVKGNTTATISWDAPLDSRGSDVTGYTVTAYTSGNVAAGTCTSVAPTETCVVTGLTNGTPYTFKVTATNGIGTSAQSTASSAATPSTVPNAPTGVTVASGDAQVTVSFTAPTNNGGSSVTGYTVTASDGSTISGTTSPLTITGLTNGTAYTFTVKATNINGDSVASSASASSTPVASSIPILVTPGQPTGNPYVGSTLTSNVTFSGSPTPTQTYQWKVCESQTDLSSCTNISGATAASYIPTISELGKYIVVVATATNRVGSATETSNPTLVIQPEIDLVAPSPVPGATAGTAYVLSLAAAGGVGAFAYTVSNGSLPAGLTLDPSTGQLAGTPTTAGTYTFTVRATDSNGVFKDVVVTLVVAAATVTPTPTPSPTPTPTPTPTPPSDTCDSACQSAREAAATKAAADKAAADAIAKAAADKAAADAAAAAKAKSDTAATTASTKATADAAAAAAAAKAAVERAAEAAAAKAAADKASADAAARAKAASDAQAAANKAAADAAAALRNSSTSAAAKAAATASAQKAAADAQAAVRAAATAAQQAAAARNTAANANKQVDIAINSLNSRTAASQASAQANAIAAAAKAAANEAAAAAETRAAEARAAAAAAQRAASSTAARIATEQKEAATAAALAKVAADAAAKATAEKIATANAAKVASEALLKVLEEKAALAQQAAQTSDQTVRSEIAKKLEEIEVKAVEAEKIAEEATADAEEAIAEYEEAIDDAAEATQVAETQAEEAVTVKAESASKNAAATKAAAAATVAAKVATAAKAAAAKVPAKAVITKKPATSSKNSATATVTGLKPGQKVKVTVNVKPKP